MINIINDTMASKSISNVIYCDSQGNAATATPPCPKCKKYMINSNGINRSAGANLYLCFTCKCYISTCFSCSYYTALNTVDGDDPQNRYENTLFVSEVKCINSIDTHNVKFAEYTKVVEIPDHLRYTRLLMTYLPCDICHKTPLPEHY